MPAGKKKYSTKLAILVTACGVVLLGVVVGGLILRCRALELRLDEVFLESLRSHTIESGRSAQRLIDETQLLLEDAVLLLKEKERPLDKVWVNPLLSTVNVGGRQLELNYLNMDDLEKAALGSEEQRVLQQLRRGISVVGDIVSESEELYFLVVCPVELEGQLVGAVQARIVASQLIEQGHDSALFQSIHRVIAGEDGRVVCGSVVETRGVSLLQLGERDGLPQVYAEQFEHLYQSSESGAFCYETLQGQGYAAWGPVSYNGWRVVHFSQTPDLRIQRSSMTQTVVLVMSLAVCAAMAAFIWRQRAKLAAEKLRYSALAEFKDTLIFEYNCQKDSMEFTSNALETLDLENARLEDVTDLKNEFAVFHPDDIETVRQALWSAEHMDEDQIEHDRIRLKRRDGKYSWYRSQYKAVFGPEGKVIRVIGTLTDISAQIDREIELRNQAQRDPLTGVYNRAGVKLINARLEQISRGILFMLDMDDFKSVNDTYGHAAGDRLLMAIGGVLLETFRTDDIVARVGGDEFVAFLSGSDSRVTAELKGQELLERIRNLKVDGIATQVTVSVGAASAPAQGRTYEALSQAADEAMYQVKHGGKSGFVLR